jgi:hypothetical protein
MPAGPLWNSKSQNESWGRSSSSGPTRNRLADERSVAPNPITGCEIVAAFVRQGQQLRLVFATHQVMLRGHALRRIEIAMQRMELAFLGSLPGNQRLLVTEGQPVITVIELRVVGEEEKPSRG